MNDIRGGNVSFEMGSTGVRKFDIAVFDNVNLTESVNLSLKRKGEFQLTRAWKTPRLVELFALIGRVI